MKLGLAAVWAGLILGLMPGAAHAAVVVDIRQTGDSVFVSGAGTLNIDDAISEGGVLTNGGIYANTAFLVSGMLDPNALVGAVTYDAISGPAQFGSGPLVPPTATAGDVFGVIGGTIPGVFVGGFFKSGDAISFTETFGHQSFASLGLAPDTYVYVLPNDTVTVNINPVPIPASAPMFGAALLALGAVGYGVRRTKAAAAA